MNRDEGRSPGSTPSDREVVGSPSLGYALCRTRVLAKTFLLLARERGIGAVLRAEPGRRRELAEALALRSYGEVQRARAGQPQRALDFRMYLRPTPAQVADHARWILAYGVWEPAITYLVRRRVRRGSLVLDIGANLGYYVLLLSRLVGPEGHVLGFEPEPSNLELLRKTVELNRATNVELSNAAVGDRDGTARLFLSERAPGLHSVVNAVGSGFTEVPMRRLDALTPARKVDFLLVDAEGAEALVVEGGTALLERDRPEIVMEFTPSVWKEHPATLRWLEERYSIYRIVESPHLVSPATPEALLRLPKAVNLFLTPRDRNSSAPSSGSARQTSK